MRFALWCNYLSASLAIILQLSGRMDFYKSLNYLQIIIILSIIAFMISLLIEWLKNQNPAARRFGPGILILAASVAIELLNFWLQFTGAFTIFFLAGVLGFVLSLGIVSGYYMRDSLRTAAEKERLEYQMESANRQLDLQRLQFQKIAENDALIKSQRHDLHHQLTVLQEYYEQNEREKLGNYLKA